MDAALLQKLMTGTGSSSQLVGGFVVGMLYAVIGVLSAIGSIVVFRRIFQGRWEQIFWSSFLVAIAAFYLSFAAYFGARPKLGKRNWSSLPLFLLVLCVGCFTDLPSRLALRCMAFGTSPIVCSALHSSACRRRKFPWATACFA